jgi:hypothetical protein
MSFQEQVFASEDLKRHIFSFGYPGHRNHMNALCKEVRHETVSRYGKELLTSVPRYYFQCLGKREDILNDLLLFFRCNRCQCCSRHCHRKPAIIIDHPHGFMFLEGEEKRVPEDKFVDLCDCYCRRNMRRMVQDYSDYL